MSEQIRITDGNAIRFQFELFGKKMEAQIEGSAAEKKQALGVSVDEVAQEVIERYAKKFSKFVEAQIVGNDPLGTELGLRGNGPKRADAIAKEMKGAQLNAEGIALRKTGSSLIQWVDRPASGRLSSTDQKIQDKAHKILRKGTMPTSPFGVGPHREFDIHMEPAGDIAQRRWARARQAPSPEGTLITSSSSTSSSRTDSEAARLNARQAAGAWRGTPVSTDEVSESTEEEASDTGSQTSAGARILATQQQGRLAAYQVPYTDGTLSDSNQLAPSLASSRSESPSSSAGDVPSNDEEEWRKFWWQHERPVQLNIQLVGPDQNKRMTLQYKRMTLQSHRVDSDGNCFFTSYAECLKKLRRPDGQIEYSADDVSELNQLDGGSRTEGPKAIDQKVIREQTALAILKRQDLGEAARIILDVLTSDKPSHQTAKGELAGREFWSERDVSGASEVLLNRRKMNEWTEDDKKLALEAAAWAVLQGTPGSQNSRGSCVWGSTSLVPLLNGHLNENIGCLTAQDNEGQIVIGATDAEDHTAYFIIAQQGGDHIQWAETAQT